MNKIFIVLALLFLTLAIVGAGCQPEAGTGEETEPGTATGEVTEWCKAGASWSWEGMTDSGYEGASWIIKGLEEFKDDTYCHVTLETTAPEEEFTIEYYFKEVDGEVVDVWMIMKDQTGQVREMHVTAEGM